MTVWRPPHNPWMDVYTDLCTDADGTKNIVTRFRQVIEAIPIAVGSSYVSNLATGLTAVKNGRNVRVLVNASEGLLASQSQVFDCIVIGVP